MVEMDLVKVTEKVNLHWQDEIEAVSLATEQFLICIVSTEEFIHFLQNVISNKVSEP